MNKTQCTCTKHERHNSGVCTREGEAQYDNDGIYCARLCDACWHHSGYRAATDSTVRHDYLDAGEYLESNY